MKYAPKKSLFPLFVGAAASHIAENTVPSVRIPGTVPDVQWLLCCSFGIGTFNHLEKIRQNLGNLFKVLGEEKTY